MTIFSLFPVTSHSGDCNNTVMGGGCSGQVDTGAAPHMKTQPQAKAVSKAEKSVGSASKPEVGIKAVKVSNTTR